MRFLYIITIIGCAGAIQKTSQSLENDGYVISNELGRAYKTMYLARTWNNAKRMCIVQGAKLAVPKTEEEFKFLQQLVRKMEYNDIIGTDYKLLVWVGISNIANYTMWENVDGQNINDTGFHKWAKGNGETFSDSDLEPRCVGIDAMNDGLRDFWCHHHQPYICEKTVS
ncbi:CD209 antigen-like protein D isoform X1 [Amyelois transitella]|uniref:CD209 antigen-like protein D isoform X1 n=1 Tax=Amyelois transitella TaxID=680683 RepID=UPI00067C44F5|nr:CD209 antigen-like protein D isoform X1 [Amyelois transitella]XP_060804038.1 CD209 antigen-like protein D isoform X1 [Amyelois transitella]XP_060804039.1 CD209 antigen-like protein D isoform X1 [Amyelois transitella]